MKKLFEKLKEENFLQKCPDGIKYRRLAFYLGELNAIHPFRFRNQVAQELFIPILSMKMGCNLNFDAINQEDMMNGYIRAYSGDYS